MGQSSEKDQLRFTPPVQTSYAFLEAIKEHEEEGLEIDGKDIRQTGKNCMMDLLS